MHEEVRKQYLRQTRSIEAQLRKLLDEIHDSVPDSDRARRRSTSAKIDLLITDFEDTIFLEPNASSRKTRDRMIGEIQERQDQLLDLMAAQARARRTIYREMEDLDLDQRRSELQQIEKELDADFPRP